MKVLTARVVNGSVDVPKELEGAPVTILAPDAAGYTPTPDEEQELTEALAEIRSGNYIEADELLRELNGISD